MQKPAKGALADSSFENIQDLTGQATFAIQLTPAAVFGEKTWSASRSYQADGSVQYMPTP